MSRATVGIDVGRVRRFANTTAGVGELADWLDTWGEALAICEAAGGYELPLVEGLRKAGVSVHVAHPNPVWDFTQACGRQAKTDRLDAVVRNACSGDGIAASLRSSR